MAIPVLNTLDLRGNRIVGSGDPLADADLIPKKWGEDNFDGDTLGPGPGISIEEGTIIVKTGDGMEYDDTGGIKPAPDPTGGIEVGESGIKVKARPTLTTTVNGLGVADEGIGTAQLADDAVTKPKLAAESVDTSKLDPEALGDGLEVDDAKLKVKATGALEVDGDGVDIKEGGVETEHLDDDSVTKPKLAEASVDTTKLDPAIVGDGIEIDDGKLQVNIDEGLEIDDVSKGIRTKLHGSLQIVGEGFVAVKPAPDSGLDIHSTGLHVNLGAGLEVNAGLVRARLSEDLEFDNDSIKLSRDVVFGEEGPSFKTVHEIIGNGSDLSFIFEHDDGAIHGKDPSVNLLVQVYSVQSSGNLLVQVTPTVRLYLVGGVPTVEVEFGSAPEIGENYRVVIIG